MKYKILIIITLVFYSMDFSSAQNMKEPTKPEATESWDFVPKKVNTNQDNIPSDAIVLFDGSDLSKWKSDKTGGLAKWMINKDKSMTVKTGEGDILTKQEFGSVQLHLEWRSPKKIIKEGQHRGNSGIFLQNKYEIQILDNYTNKTYSNGQAGSVYKQTPPLVNACRAPGVWQTYDIIFEAPTFGNKGERLTPAYVTVLHNGVLVQNHTKILGTTEYIGWPKNKPHGKGPIKLQDHDCEVSYRNIWIRNL